MKKFFLTLAVAVSTLAASAQTVFAPAGAEWWFQYNSIGGPGYERCFVAGSALHQGQLCSFIGGESWHYAGNGYYASSGPGSVGSDTLFFATVGDRVLYAYSGQPLQPLLDFGQPAGTVTRVYMDSLCSVRTDTAADIVVDTVFTTPLYGSSLRVQRRRARVVNQTQPGSQALYREFTGDVIERIGFPNTIFFPRPPCPLLEDYSWLISYRDQDVTYGGAPLINVLGTSPQVNLTELTVWPNPSATGRFQLRGGANRPYTVSDALGRTIQTGASPELDLSAQPAGLYVLRATDAAGRGLTRRLVRE